MQADRVTYIIFPILHPVITATQQQIEHYHRKCKNVFNIIFFLVFKLISKHTDFLRKWSVNFFPCYIGTAQCNTPSNGL